MSWSFTNQLSNIWDDYAVIDYPASSAQETIVYRTSRHVSYTNVATWSAINDKPITQNFKATYSFTSLTPYARLRNVLTEVSSDRYPVLLPDYACSTHECSVSSGSLTIPFSYSNSIKQPWSLTSPALLVGDGRSFAVEFDSSTINYDDSDPSVTSATVTLVGTVPNIGSCIYYPLKSATVLGSSTVRSRYYKAEMDVDWEIETPRVYYPFRNASGNPSDTDMPLPKEVINMSTALPDTVFANRRVRQKIDIPSISDQKQSITYAANYNDSLDSKDRQDYLIKSIHAKHMQAASPMTMVTDQPNVTASCIPASDELTVSYGAYTFDIQFSYMEHS